MKTRRPNRAAVALALAMALLGLGGCATFSPDGGFGAVASSVKTHTGQEVRWARTEADRQANARRVAELLAQPLSLEKAVEVALLNQPGLQAAFETLGIAEADLVQASRLSNPALVLGRSVQGTEVEREIGLHLGLGSLLALPLRREIESRRFAQAQATAALAVLTLAADTRRAWIQAVGAEETARYARQVLEAAQAGSELARRMAEVGNFNRLQLSREQAFEADAALALARAEQARRSARERLVRLLGLWGEPAAALRLPPRLPDLPAAPRELPDVERIAIAQRLDVQGARLAVEQSARELGLTRATRFIDGLELGAARATSNEGPPHRSVEIGFRLPVFDSGDARLARAEHQHRQSVQRAAQTAIDARSEVREAYAAYRSAWDIARHLRDEVVPLRKRISEENLLRYNAMLIGVFELLADARTQVTSVSAAIDALREFWLAQAELDMALLGRPGLSAAAAVLAPAGGAGTPGAAGADPH